MRKFSIMAAVAALAFAVCSTSEAGIFGNRSRGHHHNQVRAQVVAVPVVAAPIVAAQVVASPVYAAPQAIVAPVVAQPVYGGSAAVAVPVTVPGCNQFFVK